MCKKLIKNSQPFGKKFQKTVGGIFFDSHCIFKVRSYSIFHSNLAPSQTVSPWQQKGIYKVWVLEVRHSGGGLQLTPKLFMLACPVIRQSIVAAAATGTDGALCRIGVKKRHGEDWDNAVWIKVEESFPDTHTLAKCGRSATTLS